jgi:hypothetical protein
MEKFKIIKIDGYRDGGTISIQTNQGDYCIDGRLLRHDIENLTEGMLFLGYPKDNQPLSLEDAKKIKTKIKSALKSFTGQVHEYYLSKIKDIKTK